MYTHTYMRIEHNFGNYHLKQPLMFKNETLNFTLWQSISLNIKLFF